MKFGIPKWSRLRPIGNSALAKSALAVPILGYLILLSDKFVEWFTLHTQLCGIGRCDVLWRLQCLYFGGWIFAIAAVLYWVACPPEIKKSKDIVDFSNEEMSYFNEGHNNNRYYEMSHRYFGHNHAGGPGDRFAIIYSKADSVRPFWRSTLAVLYGIGSALVLAPTGYTLVQVLVGTFGL